MANEIAECVQKSKSTTCQLDPIPTHLVKFCLPSLLLLITQIIHSSLITEIVLVGTKSKLRNCGSFTLTIDNSVISPYLTLTHIRERRIGT